MNYDLWAFRVTNGQIFQLSLKAHVLLHNKVTYKKLYLAPITRNSTSELQVIDLWPFTMTRGRIFYHFCRGPYGNLYQTVVDTNSLSRTVNEIFHIQSGGPWPWTLHGHWGSNISTCSKAHGWLYNNLPLKRTLYLAPFSRNFTSKLLVIDFWPFTMTWGQIFYCFWKSHMWLYIRLVLIRTVYLAPLARYSTSKVVVNDLDPSWSLTVKYFNFFQTLMCDFIIFVCGKELSILHHFREIPHLSFRSLTFDLSQWPEVKYFIDFGNLICDFISELH